VNESAYVTSHGKAPAFSRGTKPLLIAPPLASRRLQRLWPWRR